MKITQIKNGVQQRRYADHVWLWRIETDKPREEVLEYCRKNLRRAALEKAEYWKRYRDPALSFDEHMEVVCGGYWSLTKTEDDYEYEVVQEYID